MSTKEFQRFSLFFIFKFFYIYILLSSYILYLQDYTGDSVTAKNLYAVLLGNKSALTGGSSKVLDSGPNDHIFIYYADHGSPGLLG